MINRITEAIQRGLNEETVSSDISYIPGAFDTARSLVRDLSRIKKNWNIQVLETEGGYQVVFEDALSIMVPTEHFASFNEDVLQVEGVNDVDLTEILDEAIMEVQEEAYKKLENTLLQNLKKNPKVQKSIVLMNYWLKTFRKSRIVDMPEPTAISLGAYEKSVKALVTQLKDDFGDDIGYIDNFTDSIEAGRGIRMEGYANLVGVAIKSQYEGVNLTLEVALNASMIPVQSIYIDNELVIDELENYRTVKALYRKVYPVGQMFEPSIFGNIKEIIMELEDDV